MTHAKPVDQTFYAAFTDNMRLLGLPAPKTLFESVGTAAATTTALARAVETYGPRVTLREIFLTVPALASGAAAVELAGIAASVTASFYVGACLGSLVYATWHSLVPYDTTLVAARHRIPLRPWLLQSATTSLQRSHQRRGGR